MITTMMFDLYNPGELIGPAFEAAPDLLFRMHSIVRISCGQYAGQIGRIVREGSGPHPQGPLDYVWYEVVLASGVHLFVAGWGWMTPVLS